MLIANCLCILLIFQNKASSSGSAAPSSKVSSSTYVFRFVSFLKLFWTSLVSHGYFICSKTSCFQLSNSLCNSSFCILWLVHIQSRGSSLSFFFFSFPFLFFSFWLALAEENDDAIIDSQDPVLICCYVFSFRTNT